jgi:hypothetical protein
VDTPSQVPEAVAARLEAADVAVRKASPSIAAGA